MRYLGIDFGTKKIGLALSDEAGTMGFPHSVIPNDHKLLTTVRELIAKENIHAIVMGESRDFSGKENAVFAKAKEFGKLLTEHTGLSISWENEALSTQEARRGPEGERVNKGAVDASAAALILTSYLSHHGHD